ALRRGVDRSEGGGRRLSDHAAPRSHLYLAPAAADGGASARVQPPVEIGVAHLHLAAAPVDEVRHVLVQPPARARQPVGAAAELGALPVELARQDPQRALLLAAPLAAQIAFGRLLELLVKPPPAEGA